MNKNERILGVVSYLFSVVGAVLVLLLAKKQRFASFHALQSLGLFVVALAGMVAWLIVAWVLSFVIPIVGAPVAAGLFALVIVLYATLFVVSIVGIVNVLRGARKPLPLVGEMTIRTYVRLRGGVSEDTSSVTE